QCPKTVVVRTDAAKVKQIVTNLVSNAVKFTEQGSVTVSVNPATTGGAIIAVRDTGIGIRREDQQLIFEEFRQVDGSSTRKYQGPGPGAAPAPPLLPLARRQPLRRVGAGPRVDLHAGAAGRAAPRPHTHPAAHAGSPAGPISG